MPQPLRLAPKFPQKAADHRPLAYPFLFYTTVTSLVPQQRTLQRRHDTIARRTGDAVAVVEAKLCMCAPILRVNAAGGSGVGWGWGWVLKYGGSFAVWNTRRIGCWELGEGRLNAWCRFICHWCCLQAMMLLTEMMTEQAMWLCDLLNGVEG